MRKLKTRAFGRCMAPFLPLLAAACLAGPASAAIVETHPFLTETAGPAPKGFEDACGVALDANENPYVSDYFHNSIDAGGTQIPGPGNGDGPCGLAVDSASDIYVNNWRHQVLKLTPPYLPAGTATIDPGPATGVAVSPANGNVYVDDGDHITEYEPSGTLIAEIGAGTLEDGYGIAISGFPATSGDIYVPDAGDNTVKVYDALGNQLPTIDGLGTPQVGFHYLVDSAVAVDPTNGHILIADAIGHGQSEHPELALDEFTSAGAYRGQIARWITHPDKEPGVNIEHHLVDAEPPGLAIGSTGKVFVSSGNFEAGESSGLDKSGKRIENSLLYEFGPTSLAASLSVTKTGSGAGMVKSSPAGVNCGSDCAAEYNITEGVTLTATPDSHSNFAGWSGAGCSGTGLCKLTMSSAQSVSAEFVAIPQQTLEVSISGAGTGTVTSSPVGIGCSSGTCSEHFNEASTVTLTATSPIHNRLAHWSGCSSEPSPTQCKVTMSTARAVSADFVAIPQQTLTVETSGDGTVVSSPIGIDCGELCSEHFDEASTVTLIAAPASHKQVKWSGCVSEPTPDECEVAVTGSQSVSASFTAIQHRLAVSVGGGGSVSASAGGISACSSSGGSCSGLYDEGEGVTLTAAPAVGFSFAGWSGACGGEGPCHLTIAADTSVTANFAPIPAAPVPARLTLGKLTVSGARASLKVIVSGPGALSAAGSNLATTNADVRAAGTTTLPLGLSAAGKRILSKRGRLKVEVTLTFSPADGSKAAITSKAVLFKLARTKRSPHSRSGRG